MADSSVAAYDRFRTAFNDVDDDQVLSLMDPEIEFHSRFAQAGGAVYRGHEGVRGWFDDLADAWEYIQVEIEHAEEVEPGRVVSLIRLHGRGRSSGLVVDEHLAHDVLIRDGRVLRLTYIDRPAAEELVGEPPPSAVKVATFDCYGTLVDWEGGIGAFLYALLLREGVEDPPPGRDLRERWEAIQFGLVRGEYKPYKQILGETTLAWCREHGVEANEAYAEAIVGSIRAWQPFPDTRPALMRARENGLRLVILSNTDRDVISHSVKQIGVEFDAVVVAEDVGSYKPSAANFERLLEVVGEDPRQVLHVAFGFKYDIGAAKQAGMRTAWVNRHQEPLPDPRVVPDHEWRDLWGLAELSSGRP